MPSKGTFEQAVRIFLEESIAFAESGAMDAMDRTRLLHKEYCSRLDARLREIGWTFEEYRTRTPEAGDHALHMKILPEVLDKIRKAKEN